MPRRPVAPSQQLPQVPGDSTQNRANDILDNRLRALEDRSREPSPVRSGYYLGRRVLTASGVYTPTAGATRAVVRMCGGGGGGGGAQGGPNLGGSAGGGSGVTIEFVLTGDAVGPGTVSIGAGGAGGTSAPTDGAAGGPTTLRIGSTTYVAAGGTGGGGMVNTVGPSDAVPGTGGSGSTSGPGIVFTSFWGGRGFVVGGGQFPGVGASSLFGTGGSIVGMNVLPSGYGSGGGGNAGFGAGSAGQAGAPGVVIIDEYS